MTERNTSIPITSNRMETAAELCQQSRPVSTMCEVGLESAHAVDVILKQRFQYSVRTDALGCCQTVHLQ